MSYYFGMKYQETSLESCNRGADEPWQLLFALFCFALLFVVNQGPARDIIH